MQPEELERLREAAARVGREAGYELVVLFGSATREEEKRTPEDLDLALRGDGPLDLVDATNRFIRALGSQAVDVVDLGRADPLLMMLVARDGVPLHEAEPGLFARFWSLAARRYADTHKFREAERERVQEFVERTGETP